MGKLLGTFIILIYAIGFADASIPFSLSNQQENYLKSLGQINLCVGPDSMPLDDINDGQHVGLNAEYMQIFQKKLKVSINLIPTTTWEESIANVKQGSCDIISLIQKTPQREKFLLFTENYVEVPFVVVTTQEKFFVSNLSDLIDKQLGIQKGYSYIDLLKNRFPKIQLVEVANRQEGLDKVNQGKLFGYLSALHLAGYAIQTGGYTNLKISGQFDELSMIKLGIGINKQRPELLPILNQAIASVAPEDKKRINSSWLTVRYQIVEDHQRVIQISIAASIILLFLVYRQFHLHRHNVQLADREKKIWQQANFDFLTNLPNRRLFQDRLEQKLSLIKRNGDPIAILLIDLDGFKAINDSLGHNQGDKLLIQAAARIQSCLRSSDTIARLGGDEFVVILENIRKEIHIEKIANKILTILKKPFQIIEEVFISASIGITMCPKDSSNLVELLKNADQAMYAAKESGRNKFHYFTPEMQKLAMDRILLAKDLRVAHEENQFELFYQPIIDIWSGEIYKAEALIRWKHPVRGFVSPVDFIPALEESKMIIEVGEMVFSVAAKQAKIWREKFHPNFQISVNTSPVQFQAKSTYLWFQLIKEIGVSPTAVGIEITESMLMEGHENMSQHLFDLRSFGFELSLDDFGTGYSSLSYLRKFDIDYLKIDQSFVRNLSAESNDMALCEAIIVMAHKLGLKIIAEGVEKEEQLLLLANAGCNYGQGYYFSKPVPANEFEVYLENNKKVISE
ncbi:EAL domain-containing protein [Aliikangiella sp. IMCC44359]|uniref:EAL domain-containing protein n=1 Tax=Aliikangiella sp. IMCC44359 TaxID=3459125 RepID=UPI00403ABE6E